MAIQIPHSAAFVAIISVGGFIGTLLVTLLIYAVVRIRKKRRTILTQTARERQLIKYPGRHLSITPSEIDRLSSFRSTRRISHSPYGLLEGWRSVQSRDSLSRRSFLSGMSRTTGANQSSYPDLNSSINMISWPLQPPAVHTKGHRGGLNQAIPLSPIRERLNDGIQSSPKLRELSTSMVDLGQIGAVRGMFVSNGRDYSQRTRNVLRKHRRSVSAGVVENVGRDLGMVLNSSEKPLTQLQRSDPKPKLIRTLSIHSQHSGNAPNERAISPTPDLPLPRWSRVQALRSHPGHISFRTSVTSSDASLESSQSQEDITQPNENVSMTFGPTKRSPMMVSPETKFWDMSNANHGNDKDYTYSTAALKLIPRHPSHHSFQSSIEQPTLSRSGSSGLSPSLVDQYGPSRSGSNASCLNMFNKDVMTSSHSIVPRPLELKRYPKSLQSPRRLPHKPETSTWISGPTNGTPLRSSTSVLQDISGNKGDLPDDCTSRPASLPNTHPFKWDNEYGIRPGKPSSLKQRSEGHKRQSRQRISYIASQSRPGSAIFTTTEEEEGEGEEEGENGLTYTRSEIPGLMVTSHTRGVSSPQPPPITIIEPQFHQYSTPGKSRLKGDGGYSATMSVYNAYNVDRMGSSEHVEWSPTPKPSAERLQKRRSRPVTGAQTNALWPLGETFNPTANSTATTINSLGVPPAPSSADTRTFNSFGPQFPQPPKRPPEWRLPTKVSVRGPRAAPARRSPTRRSPNRASPLRHTTRSPTRLASTELKAQVLQLRRMNSEILDSDASLCKQFLNMGGTSPLSGTPEITPTDGFGLVTPRSPPDSRVHELSGSGRILMETAWRNSLTKKDIVGLGISHAGDWLQQDNPWGTPERVYAEVNHLHTGS
ncbi:hypothetical protein MMC19_003477 [Ptychographa xylographoides]|nr:hypothetical protein [Ptychographa xylographoides]